MKEESCELTHASGPINGGDSDALTLAGGELPVSSWWTVPGMDGLTMMSAMVEMNRLFLNYMFAYAGTQLRTDSVVRHVVFGTRWPSHN